MEVVDATTVSDEEFQAAIVRIAALVSGLADAPYHCKCGTYFRVGITDELRAVLATIKRAIAERTGESIAPDTSRFALLEIDP